MASAKPPSGPDPNRHQLPVALVQTVGAVIVAAISGAVTYAASTSPLKADIEQLKRAVAAGGSNESAVEIKELREKLGRLMQENTVLLSEIAQLKSATNIGLDILGSSKLNELPTAICVARAQSAQAIFGTSPAVVDSGFLVSFRMGKNLATVYCNKEPEGRSLVVVAGAAGESILDGEAKKIGSVLRVGR